MLSLLSTSSDRLSQSETWSPHLDSLRRLRASWGGCLASSGMTAGREPGPEELPPEICLLLARTGTVEGESCALQLCPFWSGQNIHLVEINRDIIT